MAVAVAVAVVGLLLLLLMVVAVVVVVLAEEKAGRWVARRGHLYQSPKEQRGVAAEAGETKAASSCFPTLRREGRAPPPEPLLHRLASVPVAPQRVGPYPRGDSATGSRLRMTCLNRRRAAMSQFQQKMIA